MCLWQALVGPGLNDTPTVDKAAPLHSVSIISHGQAVCERKPIQPPTAVLHATFLRHKLEQHSPDTQAFYPSVGGRAGGGLSPGTTLLRAHKARIPPSSA